MYNVIKKENRREAAAVPVLGVWMWPESVEESGAREAVGRCAGIGVTDIYFLTKGLSGRVSFLSREAPVQGARDLLRELLDAAHARGIRVHAWFTSASDEAYKARHPESGRCHYFRGRDKGLISLADEGYLAYMQKVIREMLRGYDVDGLHLDYIRYNHLTYGWDESDRRRYAAAGADLALLDAWMRRAFAQDAGDGEKELLFDALRRGDESARALAKVRREDVARFAGSLCALARSEKRDLILSAALMPEGAYADTAFADLHYGQSYDDAAALYDYGIPMAYSRAYGQDSAWVRSVADGALARKLRTVAGLHAYEGATGETLRNDIAALKDAKIGGICLFREGAFVMAREEGRTLWMYNPLKKPVTALSAGDAPVPLAAFVAPGEEGRVPLPCPAAGLRAWSGGDEVPVFLGPLSPES